MQSTPRQNNQPKRSFGIGSILATIVAIVLSAAIWLNYQYLVDTVRFLQYSPSNEVAQITENNKLTNAGTFNFYAAHPQIDGSSTFNGECKSKESGMAILGCYVNDRIYIYDVTDARLSGIKEVTAAHELLHAVYERLSPADKASINKLVEAEYQKLRQDPEFAERMAFYARTEPGERDNELHSIIGTEVETISPQLEEHYEKYFTDRSHVVALFNSYNSVFTSLAAQAKEISAQLDRLSDEFKSSSDQYNSDVKQLNVDINNFNNRAARSDFTSQAEFDRQRQALLARVSEVRAERQAVNALADQYNNLREQYNSIVTQSNDLYESIDSKLSPAPKV